MRSLSNGPDPAHAVGMRLAALLALVADCGGGSPLETYDAEYTRLDGNCPPYAPERLTAGPRIEGDRTCQWAPLEDGVGCNLLCGFPEPTLIELLSWSQEARAGRLRITFPPTCTGTYSVNLQPAGR